MTRVYSKETGRVFNVDDDQVDDWKKDGYRVVKGAPDDESPDAPAKKSSK